MEQQNSLVTKNHTRSSFRTRSSQTKRPSRNSSGSARSRGSSVPALDPTADPGDDLDPTTITMATLCEDTGQGRVSSKAVQVLGNHAAWKRSNKEKRARMRTLMEAKKYGRREDTDERYVFVGPSPSGAATTAETSSRPTSSPATPAPATTSESGFGFDYNDTMATSKFNVQVRIGPNGETIVDEESLFVNRAEEQDTNNYIHVEESDATKFINSSSYSKTFRGARWTGDETEAFYAALSQFGENYELMSYVLPGRDRKACKAKFKTEDKKNSQRINHCLRNRVPYDMERLSMMTGKDFTGPVPVIRAKSPPNLEPTNPETERAAALVREQSRTPASARHVNETGAGVEPGQASSGRPGVKAALSSAPQKAKKPANGLSQGDVEVLGTIDDDWD